jgi:hypothetical protein
MNETYRSPGTRGEAQPGDLTFRFPGGFAGPGESIIVRLNGGRTVSLCHREFPDEGLRRCIRAAEE